MRRRAVPQKRLVLCNRSNEDMPYLIQPPETTRFQVYRLESQDGTSLHSEVLVPQAASQHDKLASGWVESQSQIALIIKFLPPSPGEADYLYRSFQDCLYAHIPGSGESSVVAVRLTALCDPPCEAIESKKYSEDEPTCCLPSKVRGPWRMPIDKFPSRPPPALPKLTPTLLENRSLGLALCEDSDGRNQNVQEMFPEETTVGTKVNDKLDQAYGSFSGEKKPDPASEYKKDSDDSAVMSGPRRPRPHSPENDDEWASETKSLGADSSVTNFDQQIASNSSRTLVSRVDCVEDAKSIVERMRMRHVANKRKSGKLGGVGQRVVFSNKEKAKMQGTVCDSARQGEDGKSGQVGISLKEFDNIVSESSLRRKELEEAKSHPENARFDRDEVEFYRRHITMDMKRRKEKERRHRQEFSYSNPYRDLVDQSNARTRAAAVDRYIEQRSPLVASMHPLSKSPKRLSAARRRHSPLRKIEVSGTGRMASSINQGRRPANTRKRKKKRRHPGRSGEFCDLESTLKLPEYSNSEESESSSEDSSETSDNTKLSIGSMDERPRYRQAIERLEFETLRCEMTISELKVVSIGNRACENGNSSSSDEEPSNQEPTVVLHKDDELEFYRSFIGAPNVTRNEKSAVEHDPEWLNRMDQSDEYLKDYEKELRQELDFEFGEGK